jgi:hypothetical protein
MGYYAEQDWETRQQEQDEMENDEYYIHWLNMMADESFINETQTFYNEGEL